MRVDFGYFHKFKFPSSLHPLKAKWSNVTPRLLSFPSFHKRQDQTRAEGIAEWKNIKWEYEEQVVVVFLGEMVNVEYDSRSRTHKKITLEINSFILIWK